MVYIHVAHPINVRDHNQRQENDYEPYKWMDDVRSQGMDQRSDFDAQEQRGVSPILAISSAFTMEVSNIYRTNLFLWYIYICFLLTLRLNRGMVKLESLYDGR